MRRRGNAIIEVSRGDFRLLRLVAEVPVALLQVVSKILAVPLSCSVPCFKKRMFEKKSCLS